MGKLFQDSGGSKEARTAETIHIFAMIEKLDWEDLTDNDRKFLRDIRTNLQQYGVATTISPKQLFWLRDIKDRLIN